MPEEPAASNSTLVLVVSGSRPLPAPSLLRHLSHCLNACHGRVHLRVLIDQAQVAAWTYRLDGFWHHPTRVYQTLAAAFSEAPPGDADD